MRRNLQTTAGFKSKDVAWSVVARSACSLCKHNKRNAGAGIQRPIVAAAHRSGLQLVVGSSRQGVAPHRQCNNATSIARSHFMGYRRPRVFQRQRALEPNSAHSKPEQMQKPKSGASVVWWRSAFILRVHALRPNHSLNRTVCGGSALGFISFSPKANPPQTAG